MSIKHANPPRIALWILQWLYSRRDQEAVTGDLIERFRDGQSVRWFWHQTLAAMLIEASSRIWFAAAGTLIILCIPWTQMFPIEAIMASMHWSARLAWVIAIEITTVLTILPIYAALFIYSGMWRWSSLPHVGITSFVLFSLGDLAFVRWVSGHPQAVCVQSTGLTVMQLIWIFATLLISGRPPRNAAPVAV